MLEDEVRVSLYMKWAARTRLRKRLLGADKVSVTNERAVCSTVVSAVGNHKDSAKPRGLLWTKTED